MILLPNFGFIFVDVKDKEQAEKYEKFFLFAEEVDSYLDMQGRFKIPIWFIISNEKYHYKTWFWIPVSDVTRAGFVFEAKDGKGIILGGPVPIDEFVQVADTNNLERIFSKLFRL